MNNKRCFVAFAITLFLCRGTICASPSQVKSDDAVKAAMTYLRHCYPDMKYSVETIVSYYGTDGYPLLYEVITSKDRSVLLSASKSCVPILADYLNGGVSIVKEYMSNRLPCNLTAIIEDYIEQIDSSFYGVDTLLYFADKWDSLIGGNMYYTNSGGVPQLLNTEWGQSVSDDYSASANTGDYYAYNHLIPCGQDDGDTCGHALVGCVAVAMSQIMNYWKYPVVSACLNNQFDWCNMPQSLDSRMNNYGIKRDAVARLMAICAKSVDMDYGCSSSSARTSDARDALVGMMQYSKDAVLLKKTIFMTNNAWKKKMKDELEKGRPIMYAAYRSDGFLQFSGHAFVCDGYQGELFNINWGWNGSCNGLFRLDSLCPGDRDYSYSHEAILGIYPQMEMDICDYSQPIELFYWQYYIIHSFGWNYSDNNPLPPYLPKPYEITPQTMTTLKSADASVRAEFRTIPAGATAKYQAHKEIVLQDGFEAEWGCDFTAEIVPCPACEEPEVIPILTAASVAPPAVTERQDSVEAEYFAPRGTLDDDGFTQADIHPNPTTGELTISINGEVDAIVIYNATGSPVGGWHTTAVGDRWLTLDVSPLTRGTYIVALRTGEGISAARFVKW